MSSTAAPKPTDTDVSAELENEVASEATAVNATSAFVVDLDGYEGPLDLLLSLARDQKVDLKKLSILRLAEQYLDFIAEWRRVRLEVAADYLVMAAWLAYLKSRLLLPEPEGDDEPSGEELAERLQFQLLRLQAMRTAIEQLLQQDRLGQDVFARGAPEPVNLNRTVEVNCSLYELLNAYAQPFRDYAVHDYVPKRPAILSVEDAIGRLQKLLGKFPDWAQLESYLPDEILGAYPRRSAVASTFAALLEMTKRGETRLRQGQTFGPIFVKAGGGND